MIKEAEALIQVREDDHPGKLLEAKALLLSASKEDASGEAFELLAQTLFWLGEYTSDNQEKDHYFSEGVEHGKKAVEKRANSVAAHLWYAANMGAHGLVRGIMSSLFYLGPIDKHGKKAVELDQTYFYGAPLRLMGRYYHQAPGWPVGKGDLSKGIKHLEKAVEVGPEFLLNHLYLAEAYLARRKKAEAKTLIDQILATEPTIFPIYQNRLRAEAKALRSKT